MIENMDMVPSNKVGRRVGVEGAIVINSESNITDFYELMESL